MVAARDKRLADDATSARALQAKLDDATAQNAELRQALEKMGKDADKLLGEKGTLASALADAKSRLEELRKAQAAADARLATFRQLALKLHKMIDAGELSIALRDGRMVIRLPNDVLFDSGQNGSEAGGPGGAEVARQRAQDAPRPPLPGGRAHRQPADPNRALPVELGAVERARRPGGALPDRPGDAAGRCSPRLATASSIIVAPNDTAASRAKNRRIEITLQPNIDELVAVPDVK